MEKVIQYIKNLIAYNKLDDAENLVFSLLKENAKNSELFSIAGFLSYKRENFKDAKIYFEQALYYDLKNVDHYINLANVYIKTGNFKKALKILRDGYKIASVNSELLYLMALVYQFVSDFDNAKVYYKKSIKADKANIQALINLGVLYWEEGDIESAGKLFLEALKIEPNNLMVLSSLANVYIFENRYEEAKKLLYKAISLNKRFAKGWNTLGNLYDELNDLKKAESCYLKAINIDSNLYSAKTNYSFVLLKKGDYEKGWKFYESRLYRGSHEKPLVVSFDKLLKRNIDFSKKVLYLYQEQGYGDTLQFIRFLPFFKEKNAEIFVTVQKGLKKLLQQNYPYVSFVDEMDFDKFDYHMPITSSGYIFNIKRENIPFKDSYLTVDKKESKLFVKNLIKDDTKTKIGIVWKSEINKKMGLNALKDKKSKSIPLEIFMEIFKEFDCDLYSLQKGITEKEKKILESNDVIVLESHINDFYDTALIVNELDLIVSIDTAMIHLSGAMGKPSVVILPFYCDWRWGIDEEISSWYNSVSIVRNRKIDDWRDIIKSASEHIKNRIS